MVKTPRSAWAVLIVVYIAGLAGPIARMKASPVLPAIIGTLGLNYSEAGWVMSILNLAGFILAIPAGFFVTRFGEKATGLSALAFLFLGSILGAVSQDLPVLLVSRVIEGCGFILYHIAGGTALARVFPKNKMGLVMGIWSTVITIGYLISLNIVPFIDTAAGHAWKIVWWVNAGYALLMFFIFLALFRVPKVIRDEKRQEESAISKAIIGEALKNRHLWIIVFVFFTFSTLQQSFTQFYPTFLNAEMGFDMSQASFLVSIQMIVLTAPLFGWISDKIQSRKKILVLGLAALGILNLFPYGLTGAGPVVMYLIIRGVFEDSLPAMCFASVPDLAKKVQYTGLVMATLNMGQNLGNLVGPPTFGWLIDQTGSWATSGYIMAPLALLAILLLLILKPLK